MNNLSITRQSVYSVAKTGNRQPHPVKLPFTQIIQSNKVGQSVKKVMMAACMAGLAYMPSAQAAITDAELQQFVASMTAAANAKNINQVSRLVADDALISVSRKGKTSTLNKSSYLNLLQNNWSKAVQYRYSMDLTNVVNVGGQVKADVVTTETITEPNQKLTLVTTSRATFSEVNNNVVLSRAISQLAIEQHN